MRRVLAGGLAIGSLTAGFGAIDLLSPWVLHEGTQVSDVGYGTLAGIIVPAGLLAREREQLAAAALALLMAGLAAGESPLLVAAAVVAGGAVVAGEPRRVLTRPRSGVLIALAVVACWPVTRYALDMAANQRHGVAPHDAHLALHAWAALAAAALAVLFTALLAAARADGSRVPGLSVSLAVLVWALASLAFTHSAGALDAPWAWAAMAWAAAFGLGTFATGLQNPR